LSFLLVKKKTAGLFHLVLVFEGTKITFEQRFLRGTQTFSKETISR